MVSSQSPTLTMVFAIALFFAMASISSGVRSLGFFTFAGNDFFQYVVKWDPLVQASRERLRAADNTPLKTIISILLLICESCERTCPLSSDIHRPAGQRIGAVGASEAVVRRRPCWVAVGEEEGVLVLANLLPSWPLPALRAH